MKMTCSQAGAIGGILLLFLAQLAMATEAIEVLHLGQPDNSTPAMAGFYFVNPEGELVTADPVEAGLATTSSADFSALPAAGSSAESEAKDSISNKPAQANDDEDKSQRILVRIRRKPPDSSLWKQFQCERHGLFYTNDGRCILPAWNQPGVKQHLLSRPGILPMPRHR